MDRPPEPDPARRYAPRRHAVPPTLPAPGAATSPPGAEARAQTMGTRPGAGHIAPRRAGGRRSDASGQPFTGRRSYGGGGRTLPCGRARGGGPRRCATCLWPDRAGPHVARPTPHHGPRMPCCAPSSCSKGERLQWHGALLGSAFTLQEALASLEAAKASLLDDAPPEIVAQLAAVTAGVCYDIGDQGALQHALVELQASSHQLVAGRRAPARGPLAQRSGCHLYAFGRPRPRHLPPVPGARALRASPAPASPGYDGPRGTGRDRNTWRPACPCTSRSPLDTRRRAMRRGWSTPRLRRPSINAWASSARSRTSGRPWGGWRYNGGSLRWPRSA